MNKLSALAFGDEGDFVAECFEHIRVGANVNVGATVLHLGVDLDLEW